MQIGIPVKREFYWGFRNKSDNEASDRLQVATSGETGLNEYFGAKLVAESGWQRNKC